MLLSEDCVNLQKSKTDSGEFLKEREQKDDCVAYSCLLKNELLGTSYENLRSVRDSVPLSPPSKKETQNLFQAKFQSLNIEGNKTEA